MPFLKQESNLRGLENLIQVQVDVPVRFAFNAHIGVFKTKKYSAISHFQHLNQLIFRF